MLLWQKQLAVMPDCDHLLLAVVLDYDSIEVAVMLD